MKKAQARSKSSDWTEEAEQTVHAIRHGAVDAFVVEGVDGHRVYTLQGADLPYSLLVERMPQPAAMLNSEGEVIYCNPSLAQLLGVTREDLIGVPLKDWLDGNEHVSYEELRNQRQSHREGHLHLRRSDGSSIPAAFAFTELLQEKSATGVLISDLTSSHQLMELARRLLSIQDQERRRLARELHDSVGQFLVALAMNIANVSRESDKLSAEGARCLRENTSIVDQISNEIRTISHLLHPPLLDEVGLPAALHWFVDGFTKRSNIQTTLQIPENFPRMAQDVEIAVFRAVQESLTNVHRHSGSPSCSVKIECVDNQVRVEIKDRGRGVPAEKLSSLDSSSGVGVRGMQERIRQLGGTLQMTSNSEGTTVTATLPTHCPTFSAGG
jgi:two-component system, NarL family, sensor kinase